MRPIAELKNYQHVDSIEGAGNIDLMAMAEADGQPAFVPVRPMIPGPIVALGQRAGNWLESELTTIRARRANDVQDWLDRHDTQLTRLRHTSRVLYLRLRRWLIYAGVMMVIAALVDFETHSSFLQSRIYSSLASQMTYAVAPGANSDIRFPVGGPYDKRMGYSRLPEMIGKLKAHQFTIAAQARPTPALASFTDQHGYALFRQKDAAGLVLRDRTGAVFYSSDYPGRTYATFKDVPALIGSTLMFIEDRTLLEDGYATKNPAIDWKRFAIAAGGQLASIVDSRMRQGGASTLATQIEKYQHSPGGRTDSIGEKLRQMAAATTRAYLDGTDTTETRQRILTTYLNSTPLGSRPNYGEIIGIGDALWAWYGTDFTEANRLLTDPAPQDIWRKAEIYKQVLSLLLAQRRPTYYLGNGRDDLDALTDQYLTALAQAGVIDTALYDAAQSMPLNFRPQAPLPAPASYIGRKAVASIRTELLGATGTSNYYDLDRLDLTATTTLDGRAQRNVVDVLSKLSDPVELQKLGMIGKDLLGNGDPAKVDYSVVLYERVGDRNVVRVHADSLNEPFDINSGAKMILGSTAKLRTLTTYLNIIDELYVRMHDMSAKELLRIANGDDDPLTKWTAGYLATTKTRTLSGTLEAAMQRHYSGSTGEVFFTGGGEHVFHNAEQWEGQGSPSVLQGFEYSINLVFIRLMRDVARYYGSDLPDVDPETGDLPKVGERSAYLQRFVDQESIVYLNRFYKELAGKRPDEMLNILAKHAGQNPQRLAVLYIAARPGSSLADVYKFLDKQLPKDADINNEKINQLYADCVAGKYTLGDLGYIAHLHPLQLWLASYLNYHVTAERAEVVQASISARRQSYTWLFKTNSSHKQDMRIRILREQEAFQKILQDWHRQGYPFDKIIPSYASAIGSSGDRPDALAKLVGIILNNGIELPSSDIQEMQFAGGTPYETDVVARPDAPKRVMAPEVAATLKHAMMGVVQEGTGVRLRNVYLGTDGQPLPVGGKTGTGDNRYDRYAPGGRLIESRAVDRTGTFMFFLGDRFFGTITAYAGTDAGKYTFMSSLAVQLLKVLEPALSPMTGRPASEGNVSISQN